MGWTYFSDQLRKVIIRNKHIGYNLNAMRQSASLVINPITVVNFAALFIFYTYLATPSREDYVQLCTSKKSVIEES